MMTVPGAPGRSSAGVNTRPTSGSMPSVARKPAVTSAPIRRRGSPLPVRFADDRSLYAAKLEKTVAARRKSR